MQDEIEYFCCNSLVEAGDLLNKKEISLIVVDGAEEGVRLMQSLSSDNDHPLPRLLVLTEESFQSLPQEMLLPDDTLFLEKPFNPKEFPFLVLKALEESPISYSLPPIESEKTEEAERGEETEKREKGAPEDFYSYFNQGFSCLSRRDLDGARENWLQALSKRPGDKRVQANLARLEKMINTVKES
jgi:hypothetical protein